MANGSYTFSLARKKEFFKIMTNDLETKMMNVQTKEEKLEILNDSIQEDADTESSYFIVAEHLKLQGWNDQLKELFLHMVTLRFQIAKKFGIYKEYEKKVQSDWGSAPQHKMFSFYYCANIDIKLEKFCEHEGKLRCSNCYLVAYCSKECQKTHWLSHRDDCKSSLSSSGWEQNWVTEKRMPMFLTGEDIRIPTAVSHLFGNTPAFDLLHLKFNELINLMNDDVFCDPMNIIFAASGDLRHLVETIANLPVNVKSPLHIFLNDINPIIVARNFLMLLMLQSHGREAVDAVMQIWYSALLPTDQYCRVVDLFNKKILDKTNGIPAEVLILNDGLFNIKLNCTKSVITVLCQMIAQSTLDVRTDITLNPKRRDFREAYMRYMKPHQRLAWNKYLHRGLFLPFAAYDNHFNFPNKFILNPLTGSWMLPDDMDPLDGWSMQKVLQFSKVENLPINDLFGCLHFYIRNQLLKMVDVLERVPVEIDIYCQDACKLVDELKENKMSFDRIDISNLCDDNYLGIDKILKDWGPLLSKDNQNSTLITLFMNWFDSKPPSLNFLKLVKQHRNSRINEALTMMLNGNCGMTHALMDEKDDFQKYLFEKLLKKKYQVVQRNEHRIVPHRFFAPVEALDSYTFLTASEDELHNAVCIAKNTLRERYVEWVLK